MSTRTKPRNELADLLAKRHDLTDQVERAVSKNAPLSAAYHASELAALDASISNRFNVDGAFRATVYHGGAVEFPWPRAAIGQTAWEKTAGRSFVDSFFATAVEAAPLLDLVTVVRTSTGGPLDWSWVASLITANGVVSMGSSINVSDPTFAGDAALGAWEYKSLLEMSTAAYDDAAIDWEAFTAQQVGGINARDLSEDMWVGDGSSKPLGLLAGLSTVNAAGASVVTFDDIAALLNGVPAAHRYSGRCTILLSPGAHIDLIEEQPLHPWHTNTIHGFPFRVDPELDDPATTKKSVVAGDFASAYVLRILPLRVDTSHHNAFEKWNTKIRVVLRADGTRMNSGACRGLVHP